MEDEGQSPGTLSLKELELCLVGGSDHRNSKTVGVENCSDIWTLILQGEYESVLRHEISQKILKLEAGPLKLDDVDRMLPSNVQKYFESQDEGVPYKCQMDILAIAVACLQLFTQNNWTGPPTKTEPLEFLSDSQQDELQIKSINDQVLSALSVDGEAAYTLTRYPLYLYLARCLLLDCRDKLTECQTADWWLLRCLYMVQHLFEERSPTLKNTIMELLQTTSKKEPLMTTENNRNVVIQCHVEAGYLYLFYYENKEAKQHFQTAKKLADLDVNFTGALGKRTHFQREDKAQLVLQVKRLGSEASVNGAGTDEEEGEPGESKDKELPKDLQLNDDQVMNSIKFKDDEEFVVKLTDVDQVVLLGLCEDLKKNNPAHEKLTEEEVQCYLQCVLTQPRNWCIQSNCLLQRSKIESSSGRRMERSMTQLEELVNQINRPTPSGHQRLQLLYSTNMIPKWELEGELATFLMKLGCHNAALEVFLRLELWEDVIVCYQQLGRREKAENVIREQLAIKETPSLWCYLGDVLKDESHYQKAWELSNQRFGRAQRNLGFLYLSKGEFEKCIECFEKALEINGLQIGVWFSCGCACMAVKEFKKAAKCFHRCVLLNSDNYEAWTNLATAYVNSGQKPRAFTMLKEAVKCDYENWRIWENMLLVSTDVGEFAQAIKAHHRLIEIKKKYADGQSLEILVKAVTENLEDSSGESASVLRPQLLELFGRVTATVTTNPEVWNHYAVLVGSGEDTQENKEKALQYMQKAHRCMTQSFNWEKDVEKCKKVLEQTTRLAKAFCECGQNHPNQATATQLLSSARLTVKGVITKVKQKQTIPLENILHADLKEPMTELEDQLHIVTELLEQLKTTT